MKIYTVGDILKTEHLGDEKYVRVEEVERLKKEKEWLVEEYCKMKWPNGWICEWASEQDYKRMTVKRMQQALKER